MTAGAGDEIPKPLTARQRRRKLGSRKVRKAERTKRTKLAQRAKARAAAAKQSR